MDYLLGAIILLASLLVERLVSTILRFWRTVRRIERHAVVGMFILLASLLVFFVLPVLQKRPPSHTTLYVFNATIVPAEFCVRGSPKLGTLAVGLEASLREGRLWSAGISHRDCLQSLDRSANPIADPEQSFAIPQRTAGDHSIEFHPLRIC